MKHPFDTITLRVDTDTKEKNKDMGIDVPVDDIQIKSVIDLGEVESYRESISDDENKANPEFTIIEMKSGSRHCIDVPYLKFDEYMSEIRNK